MTETVPPSAAPPAALPEVIDRLEKQIGKLGKEQFRVNTVLEAQNAALKATLDQLREAHTARERESALLRDQLSTTRSQERRAVLQSLLPVLDGLNEALAAGERLREAPPPPPPASFGQRVQAAWAAFQGRAPAAPPPLSAQVAAWLAGLQLVQERLLDVLAAADIYPIETAGATFDPHLHVALETAPAQHADEVGHILRELRRGYRQGDTILRYAEVVVARA